MTKQRALQIARREERRTNNPQYVVRRKDLPGSQYGVQARAPYFGEWYTSDGIQHGS